MIQEMKDKIFIITGSSGIAAETIKMALTQGAKVFYIGRDAERCQDFQDQLRKEGLDADYIVGDLVHPEVAPALVKACIEKYGRIDGLFNVAGISGRRFGDGPVHECTEEGWNITMTTNVTTQYRMCREVVRQMLDQDPDNDGLRGSILNMSSILGLSPEPKFFSTIGYAAAKGAIISMSTSMASKYALNKIRVNTIAPGLALTRMSARATQDEAITAFMKEKQPLEGGVMDAKDVASSAIFLLSNQSKSITGEVLKVDAGWSIS
ncbi:Short-chain dehydrogenase/reductase [Zobellia galactanivorans]|uniref:Short-chain dehydrogenase/reductase n=2 Tax=Zobellia galactanivorans (strain DSM 12802 / CCUG 47099 / CIP 106680 / NCIMB 13871 / Dsij) TaxID=63186 RepID=G0L981_ZOBGA|nr:Short-chain dehydrogenase/reductase [Zobellia galactanivorans]